MHHRNPSPPLGYFVDGAVWRVIIEHHEGMSLAFPVVIEHEYLVLVRANLRKRPWVRSRLAIGDLGKKTREQIYFDFVKLMAQTPPVRRNYCVSLAHERGDPMRWFAEERRMAS